jgi:hypothetical protein
MSTSALRLAGSLAACLGCLLGCAVTPNPSPLTTAHGCYDLYADNWPPALEAETGLHSLPSFIALDTVLAGPRGRRVILPTTWVVDNPSTRTAYWTEEADGYGTPLLVLTIVGPAGNFVAQLRQTNDGYSGDGVGLGRGRLAVGSLPQVQLSLVASSCAGLPR